MTTIRITETRADGPNTCEVDDDTAAFVLFRTYEHGRRVIAAHDFYLSGTVVETTVGEVAEGAVEGCGIDDLNSHPTYTREGDEFIPFVVVP
jgi:hypothetical protein